MEATMSGSARLALALGRAGFRPALASSADRRRDRRHGSKAGRETRPPNSPDGRRRLRMAGCRAIFRTDPSVFDGRFANNAWLQECPQPFSKAVWGNAVEMSLEDAKRLGIKEGDEVEVSAGERLALRDLCASPMVWRRESSSFRLATAARMPARSATTSASTSPSCAAPRRPGSRETLSLRRDRPERAPVSGDRRPLCARRQGRGACAGSRGGRSGVDGAADDELLPDLADADRRPLRVGHGHRHRTPASAATPASSPASRKTTCLRSARTKSGGAATCTGSGSTSTTMRARPTRGPCSSRCLACTARPRHASRSARSKPRCTITRASTSRSTTAASARASASRTAPTRCGASTGSATPTGQEYRNLGNPLVKAANNPDVTVRDRGVMEKCTYCVQRISFARRLAERETRLIAEGEVVTACQAACPTRAIHFGNLADPKSDLSRSCSRDPNHYVLLDQLHTRPRTTYLARVRNSNPEARREQHDRRLRLRSGAGAGGRSCPAPDDRRPDDRRLVCAPLLRPAGRRLVDRLHRLLVGNAGDDLWRLHAVHRSASASSGTTPASYGASRSRTTCGGSASATRAR